MREDFKQQMEEELKYVDVTLTDRQIEQFYRYYELLNEWNQVMNLTAITEMLFLVKDRPLSLNPENQPLEQLLDRLIGFVLRALMP